MYKVRFIIIFHNRKTRTTDILYYLARLGCLFVIRIPTYYIYIIYIRARNPRSYVTEIKICICVYYEYYIRYVIGKRNIDDDRGV